jgi:hypothetical protein
MLAVIRDMVLRQAVAAEKARQDMIARQERRREKVRMRLLCECDGGVCVSCGRRAYIRDPAGRCYKCLGL